RSKSRVDCSFPESHGTGRSFASALEETTEAPSRKDGHLNLVESVQGKQSQLPKRHLDEENALTVGLQGVCGLTPTGPSEVLLLLKTCSLHAPLGVRALHKRVQNEPRSQILRHQQNDPRVDADYV